MVIALLYKLLRKQHLTLINFMIVILTLEYIYEHAAHLYYY